MTLFQHAAAAGNADAEYNLGVCCKLGIGMAPDRAAARQWYRRAAEKGQASALLALADLLADEAASDADLGEAANCYRAAGEAGRASAFFSLGQLFERGRGIARDDGAAYECYLQAAAAGVSEAQAAVQRLEGEYGRVSQAAMFNNPITAGD